MGLHAKVEHISYTTGTRALPLYTHSGLQPLCVYIRQSTSARGITITYINSNVDELIPFFLLVHPRLRSVAAKCKKIKVGRMTTNNLQMNFSEWNDSDKY